MCGSLVLRLGAALAAVFLSSGCKRDRPDAKAVAAADPTKPPSPAKRPWQASEDIRAKLDAESVVGDYRMRVPIGWKRNTTAVGNIRMDSWESPTLPDGSRAWLQVSVVANPGTDPDKMLKDHFDSVASISEQFQQMLIERGEMGGIPFSRASYTGFDRLRGGLHMASHAYVATHQSKLLQLTAKADLATKDRVGMLDEAEAAILTFGPK